MKSTKVIILFILVLAVTVLANSSFIQNFSADSNGDSVSIKWTSITEEKIVRYDLERCATSNIFKRIHHQTAKGMPSTYSYTDSEAFMKQDVTGNDDLMSQKTYSYRLKIIFSDNTYIYSDIALVKHKPSSIRRTWGMIKEMFR